MLLYLKCLAVSVVRITKETDFYFKRREGLDKGDNVRVVSPICLPLPLTSRRRLAVMSKGGRWETTQEFMDLDIYMPFKNTSAACISYEQYSAKGLVPLLLEHSTCRFLTSVWRREVVMGKGIWEGGEIEVFRVLRESSLHPFRPYVCTHHPFLLSSLD